MLFVHSLQNLLSVDTGFQQADILFGIVPLSDERPTSSEAVQRTREAILSGIRALPQVQAAATSTHLPLGGMSWGFAVRVPSARGDQSGSSRFTWISPGYFDTMRIRLKAGRDFTDGDRAGSRPVAIVNETFVRTFLAGHPPLEGRFTSLAEPGYPDTTYEIVGVVADTKYGELREQSLPIAFVPVEQHPVLERWAWSVLAIRSTAPVAALTADVQRIVAANGLKSDVVMWRLDGQIRDGLLRDRLMSWLAVCFGVLAGLLAAVGIYGVTAYSVARRTSEIALRLALGASAPDVRRLVGTAGGSPTCGGIGDRRRRGIVDGSDDPRSAVWAGAWRSADDGGRSRTVAVGRPRGCVAAGRPCGACVACRGITRRVTVTRTASASHPLARVAPRA